MSWLSDRWGSGPSVKGLVSSVKGTGHTIGDIASNPWVQGLTDAALMATGVGAPAAAALMAAEKGGGALLKPGGNIGQGLIGGAEGALAGGGGALAGKALGSLGSAASNIPGVGGIEQGAQSIGGLLGKIPGVQGIEQGAGGVGGLIKQGVGALTGGGSSGAPSSLGSLLGSAGQWLTGNGGANALGAAEGVNAALLGQQSTNYAKQAANAVNASYNARAPLRLAGVNGMLNATRGNPFSTGATGAPNTMAATPIRSVVAGQGVTL